MGRNPLYICTGEKSDQPGSRCYLAIALTIFIVAILARVLPGPRTIDDSFITYRYSRNILAGNGFVYNPGERVLGTTTPLYTILLVILGSFMGGIHAPFPWISLLVNAFADGITCLLLLRLGRQMHSPIAGVGAALVWAVAPFSVTFAIGGLETSLYVLLLTATISSYIRGNFVLAWLFGAAALLTRPDALILLGPLAIDRFFQWVAGLRSSSLTASARKVVPEVIVFLIPTIAWIIFATLYFGNPLPHSIAAKSLAYRLPPSSALVRLLQHYATPFLEHLTFGISVIGVGFVLYIFLSILGSLHAIRVNPKIWPWVAYPWLYLITFAVANPLIFRWYLTPPLPAYFLFILVGSEQLLNQIGSEIEKRVQVRGYAQQIQTISGLVLTLALLIVAPVGLSLRDWRLHPDHGPDRPAPEMAYIQLELLYRQAADRLAIEFAGLPTPPLLAAGDVGVLGFYTGARILDTVGLNSPVSTSYYPIDASFYSINYAIPPDLILDQRPDFLIILEVYGREGLLKDLRFQKAYHLIQKIPTDMYGSDGLLIFQVIRG